MGDGGVTPHPLDELSDAAVWAMAEELFLTSAKKVIHKRPHGGVGKLVEGVRRHAAVSH